MKAYTYHTYGPPDVLKLEEVDVPKPRANEICIQTRALSINPSEWHKLTASFWMLRLSTGLSQPKQPIPGADVAGTVVGLGENVTRFKKGDRVFGRSLSGGLAEYCCIDQLAAALIPDDVAYEQAASLPLAAVTALIALRDKGQVKANQEVLINGASGGIGTFAVQLAKYCQANVTGVCSTDNIDLVKSLGADDVIDYKKQDLDSLGTSFDLIIDLVGNRKIATFRKRLRPNGKCILVGMDTPKRLFSNMFQGMMLSALGSKKFLSMDAQVTSEDLAIIVKLVSDGEIRPLIAKLYNFESVPQAFTQLGTRRSKGKMVIQL
jgi:NADPH:quinone reductase-like Zn-dependent oxidoreductase